MSIRIERIDFYSLSVALQLLFIPFGGIMSCSLLEVFLFCFAAGFRGDSNLRQSRCYEVVESLVNLNGVIVILSD